MQELTYSKIKENKRYRYYIRNNHLRGKDCGSVVVGEVEKEVMKRLSVYMKIWKKKRKSGKV